MKQISQTIRRLETELEPEYEQFLHRLPDSAIYYSSSYRRLLEDLLGCEADYFVALEGERIVGVLPLMAMEGPYGRVLNSLPFYGSNGGLLASAEWAREALIGRYNELASNSGVVTSTIVSHPLYPDANRGVRYDVIDERIGQISRLQGSAESEASLLERIDGSARRNLKKATRQGIQVRVQNDALEFLERTHRENMTEIGGKPKSSAFFNSVPKYFVAGQDYNLYVAEQAGRKLAALLLFYFNRTVEYFTPATRLDAREDQPMAPILREAMLDAATRGFTRWNWGGTWITQEGVYRFKKKWGADDYPYRYYVKVNDPAIFEQSKHELLTGYPDFYVAPFARLNENQPTASINE